MKKFKVNLPKWHGDKGYTEIEAYSPFRAAEEFAEEYDSDADYMLSEGQEIQVTVTDEAGKVTKYSLSAEVVTNYNAWEIE